MRLIPFGLVAVLTSLLASTLVPSTADAQFPAEGTLYRFEEGEGSDVIDDISGDVHGSFVGEGASYSDDVPDIGSPNEYSADLTFGSWLKILEVGFVFHDPISGGGAHGDAALEWWQKNPESGHASIFWTSTGAPDANRFNIHWGANFAGPDLDHVITGDYRNAGGSLNDIGNFRGNPPPALERFEWNHIRIERTIIDDVTSGWNWTYNGVLTGDQYKETTIDLPTDPTWLIGGRQNGDAMPMLIDEIRQSVVTRGGCPRDGQADDTRCNFLAIDPTPAGAPAPPPPAGVFTVTMDATDDSGDDLLVYSFTATNEFEEIFLSRSSQPTSSAEFTLSEGVWSITGTVDDDRQCDDDGGGVTCDMEIEIGAPPPYPDQFWIRFEEGDGTDVVASVTRGVTTTDEIIGYLEDGATLGAETASIQGGPENNFHADFAQGFAVIDKISFPFHHPISGSAAPGDATLEWLMNVPARHGHSSIFWTTYTPRDQDRFNIFWNASFTGIADSTQFVDGDFRDPVGSLERIGAPNHNTQTPIPLGEWVHFAITRTDHGDGTWGWDWYINGQVSETQQGAVTFGTLPGSHDWIICGKQKHHSLNALIDEIRITQGLLGPDDFLKIVAGGCPAEHEEQFEDTRCNLLEITGPEDNAAGNFNIKVSAWDETRDELNYTYRAEGDLGQSISRGPLPENSTGLSLSEGTWTITVTVDDNILCSDDGEDVTCTETIDVGPAPPLPDQVYYRFEDAGDGFEVVDSISGDVHGEMVDGATFSTDVPFATIPQTGEENSFSADFNAGMALMTGVPYYHHDPAVIGGADDATVEFFMNIPAPHGHAAYFWTIAENDGDANRFNMFYNASFTGIAGSDEYVEGDYREPGGSIALIGAPNHNTQRPITKGEWHHFAIVRRGAGDDSWEWAWYVDGALSETQSGALTFQALPTATTWWICGRQSSHSLTAFIDEVRMTNWALEEHELLVNTPEVVCEPTGETETDCEDGNDDDCDGLVDDDDPDCDLGVGPFVRGDCDNNGTVGGSPTEAIVLLNFAFRGGVAPSCLAACDAEANGSIGITDALRILRHSFLGVGEPDAPFPDCIASDLGTDVELGCENPLCP